MWVHTFDAPEVGRDASPENLTAVISCFGVRTNAGDPPNVRIRRSRRGSTPRKIDLRSSDTPHNSCRLCSGTLNKKSKPGFAPTFKLNW